MALRWPLLIPFSALMSGLCLAHTESFFLSFIWLAAAFCLMLFCSFIPNRIIFISSVALFYFFFGLYALGKYNENDKKEADISSYASLTPVYIEAIITSRPINTSSGSSFFVDTEAISTNGRHFKALQDKLLINIMGAETSLMRGDRIRCSARIILPRFLGLPGEFNYKRYLAYQGVAATGRVSNSKDIALLRMAAKNSLYRRVDLVAKKLGSFIRSSLPDERVSSVLVAVLLGDKKHIPQDLNDAYTAAGVNHILSISGFHVGIIALFIVALTRFFATRFESLLLRFNLRRFALLSSLPVMFAYLLLTGSAPSTARSVIMLTLFVVALYAERESDPINALLLAAFILIAISPVTLFELSFQLSFLAIWGIIISAYPTEWLVKKVKQRWLVAVVKLVIASTAASLATLLPVLFTFERASLNGIISNLLIVPILGYGAVLTGFCALPFVYVFPPIAKLLLFFSGKLTECSNCLVTIFAKLPLIQSHWFTTFDMACFLVFIFMLTLLRNSKKYLLLLLLPPCIAIFAHLNTPSPVDGRLHITMLSVGQAESIFIRLPDGKTLLVDSGGYLHDTDRDFGQRYLAPALWKLGVTDINYLLLTHSHPDHLGGMPFIVKNFPVGQFWESQVKDSDHQQLSAALSEKHIAIRQLALGEKIKLGNNITLEVLSPEINLKQKSENMLNDNQMNEESLVFRLSYIAFSMIFMADAGFDAEDKILAKRLNIASTVLKVGHHGSRYSTSDEFLRKVHPKVALISAGHGNRFGLPAPSTVEQLEKSGVKVFRTDRDGTIELSTDGASLLVSTPYSPNSEKRFLIKTLIE